MLSFFFLWILNYPPRGNKIQQSFEDEAEGEATRCGGFVDILCRLKTNADNTHRQRGCDDTHNQTSERTDARRVSPAEQNPVHPELAGAGDEGGAQQPVQPVRFLATKAAATIILTTDAGIRICTKSVLSRRRRTLRSWSTWTTPARRSRRTHFTTTRSMAKTKSRYGLHDTDRRCTDETSTL
jgi:hypothetical protein